MQKYENTVDWTGKEIYEWMFITNFFQKLLDVKKLEEQGRLK